MREINYVPTLISSKAITTQFRSSSSEIDIFGRDARGGAFRPGKHLLLVFSVYFEYHYDVFYVRGRGRGERGEGVKCVVCGEVRRKERRSD